MLKDDLQEMKRERPENLSVQVGGCRFCGQMRNIETLFAWSEENCNEVATELCDCFEAGRYTRKKQQKENAQKAIDEQFGENANDDQADEDVVELLKIIARLVIEQKIESATIEIGEGIKAKISEGKNGTKIGKTKTEKTEMET